MRFTISDETGEMTLRDMLTGMCFTGPLLTGFLAPKAAGVVGFMIGIGVGLVAGGLANYVWNRTVEYLDKLQERFKSRPWAVKLIDSGIYVWTLFLFLAGCLITFLSTRLIVQRMAG